LIVTSFRSYGGGVTSCVNEWGVEGVVEEKERKRIVDERVRREREERERERERERTRHEDDERECARAYAVAGFDPLDVTNCLLPHARLSHRTEWGCCSASRCCRSYRHPTADLRPSVSRRPFPFSPTMSRVACVYMHRCVDRQIRDHPRREQEWTVVFYYPLDPIMWIHNARAMHKYRGSFSPFIRWHYVGWIELPENTCNILSLSLSLSLSLRFVDIAKKGYGAKDLLSRKTDSIMRIIKTQYRRFRGSRFRKDLD